MRTKDKLLWEFYRKQTQIINITQAKMSKIPTDYDELVKEYISICNDYIDVVHGDTQRVGHLEYLRKKYNIKE